MTAPPSQQPEPTPTPAAPAPSPAKKRRWTWRRRLTVAGVSVVGLAIAVRLLLVVLLPVVISRLAASMGVGCRYDRLELGLLGGNVELWGARITSADGLTDLVRTDYAHANISALQLLRLRLVASRLEVDGVDLEVIRKPDGSIPLLDELAKIGGSGGAQKGTVNFSPPLRIEALRARSIEAKVRDESVSPIFERTIRVDARISGLGVPTSPATVELSLASEDLLDALRVTGTADLQGPSITSEVNFDVRGLRPAAAMAYLEPLGIAVESDRVDIAGAANISLTAAGPGTMQGAAALRNLTAYAGAEPIASLDAATVTIASLSPSDLHLTNLTVDGGSLRLGRTSSGALRVPPMTIGPRPALAQGAPAPAAATRSANTGASSFRWRLDTATIKGIETTFNDLFVSPPASLGLNLTSLTIADLASPAAGGTQATFTAELTAPGLASSVRAAGKISPASDAPAITAEVAIDGISLDAATPYLRPLGLEPAMDAAALRCDVAARIAPADGGPRLHASIKGVTLREGDATLLELAEVAIDGLRASDGLDVESIRATGPALTVRLRDEATLEACGFHITAPPAAAPTRAAAATPAAPSPAPRQLELPRLRIGSLTWGGAAIRLEDLTTEAAAPVEITDAGLEISGLLFDPESPETATPGSIRAWVRTPGVVDRFELTGTLRPAPASLAADVAVTSEGVQLVRFAPYLRPLGIEPTLRDGAVSLHAAASVAQSPDGVTLTAMLKDVSVEQAGEPLAQAAQLGVDRVTFRGQAVDVGRITIESATASAIRHEDGSIETAGIRIAPGEQRAPTPATPPDPFAILESLPEVSLAGLSARDVSLSWTDRAAAQPVDVRLALDATVGTLAPRNPDAQPAAFEVRVGGEGVADRLQITGTLRITPTAIDLNAKAEGDRLAGTPLAAYLPPSVEPAFDRATLSAELAASLSRVNEGGFAATLRVQSLDWRESGDEAPFAGLDTLDIRVRRLDLPGGVIDIERIAASGAAASAARSADGRFEILGLVLGGSPGDEQIVIPAAPTADAPADVQQIVGDARNGTLPAITIEEIDLHVGRATFTDATGALAAPVALTDFRLRSIAPVSVRPDRPANSPPVELAITGGVEPVIGNLNAQARLAPLAWRPSAAITLTADGIDGAGLAALIPGIETIIDPTPLVDGRLRASAEVDASVRRRGPVRIDFGRAMDLTLKVEGVELRLGEDGPLLAGVERIEGEQIRLDPATGNVIAKSIEITNLAGSGWRDEAGIHILGVVLRTGDGGRQPAEPAEPEQTSDTTIASAEPTPESPQPPASAPATPSTAGEIRIDRLVISGADLRFEDRLLTPPVTLPITALEADVRGLSSLAMVQDRPIKFNISATAGKVSLPKPLRGGVLTGALGDLGRMMTGNTPSGEPEMEDRDLFSQCIASGTMSFAPRPRGRILAAISGVELTALRGLAQAAGASVGGGIFDGRVELLGRDDGGLDVRSRLVFTDLQYAEPPNGPIARYLSLPVPLDVAIGAVQAADGSITLPVDLTLDGTGLTTGKVLGAATGAIASVLTTAVASTPVKVVTGFAGLFGSTSSEKRWIEEDPIFVEFAPGLTVLSPAAQQQVEEVLRRARSDKNVQVVIEHEFGPADLELAARRANPPREQAQVLAEDLRRRRLDLIARRSALLAPARASAADPSHAEAVEQLRQLQTELADVEDAFDELYDLLRRGAERQAGRRARSAALELADARLDHLRRMVRDIAGAAGGERIALGNPRAVPASEGASRLVIRLRRAGK